MITMAPPYAPKLRYLCDDPRCCEDGCPEVRCRTCGEQWPCPDYIAAHTPTQVEAQHRWIDHVRFRNDPDMWRWLARQRAGS